MSCPDCVRGAIHTHLEPRGTTTTLHGRTCYVALPSPSFSPSPSRTPRTSSSSPALPSKHTVIVLSDAFGLSLPNTPLLCDALASATSARVLAPDFFPCPPLDLAVLGYSDRLRQRVRWWDVWGWVLKLVLALRVGVAMGVFWWRCRPEKTLGIARGFARDVREGIGGGKLGVAGFCWGGYAATRLCAEENVDGKGKGLVDVAFVAHPSGLKVPDIILDVVGRFGTKYCLAIGDKDWIIPPEEVVKIEAALKAKFGEPEDGGYQVRSYDGCGHGFVTRAAPGKDEEAVGMENARQQAVEWFNKYLNV